jgi:hypothetical protein
VREVQRAPTLEWAGRPARVHAVAIHARARIKARVEPLRRGLAGHDPDVVRQHAVQPVGGRGLAVVRGHLAAGVHARVGPAGDGERDLAAEQHRERLLQHALHGAQAAGLPGPAREVAAVVLEEEPRGHPRLRATICR